MTGQSKFYRRCYYLAGFLLRTVYRFRVIGHENINEGAGIFCINHSSLMDPIFLGVALDKNIQIHFIAKIELFKTPVVSWLVRGLGAISVDRSKADIGTIKECLNYLKKGSKIGIFPEGTRAHEDNVESAKQGAIKIAERAKVPIIPVYLPRRKKLFSKLFIVIGKPYIIEKQNGKRTNADYDKLTIELMEKIQSLKGFATS